MRLTNKPVFYYLIDMIMPKNCRHELHVAAENNLRVCSDTLHFLRNHQHHVKVEIKNDKNHAA